MSDSRFWRGATVVALVGVFYLGHSLQDSSGVSLPGLATEVQAGDVATVVPANHQTVKIVTTSNDGQTINVWSTRTTSKTVTFVGSYSVKPQKPK